MRRTHRLAQSSDIGRHAGESLRHTAGRGEGGGGVAAREEKMSHCSDPENASGWGDEMKEGDHGGQGTAIHHSISRRIVGAMRRDGFDSETFDTLRAKKRRT